MLAGKFVLRDSRCMVDKLITIPGFYKHPNISLLFILYKPCDYYGEPAYSKDIYKLRSELTVNYSTGAGGFEPPIFSLGGCCHIQAWPCALS